MYVYENLLVWTGDKTGRLTCPGVTEIEVSTPPEFGGPEGYWSPEQLLVGAVSSCLQSTFLFFAEKSAITLVESSCKASGRMEKTPEGLRFTGVEVSFVVKVAGEADREKVLRLESKLEKYCPVSASLKCPVTLHLEVSV
jgi:organic hydroperoxide reductase OsmC/OhrA